MTQVEIQYTDENGSTTEVKTAALLPQGYIRETVLRDDFVQMVLTFSTHETVITKVGVTVSA